MARIILQAIKLAPRLLWQFLFQPSKAFDFISPKKKNIYISIWSFFFSGLLLGGILAIPHYYLYNDLGQSILFALAIAVAVTIAVAVGISGVVSGIVSGRPIIVGYSALVVAVVFPFVFVGAGAGVFAFIGAGALAGGLIKYSLTIADVLVVIIIIAIAVAVAVVIYIVPDFFLIAFLLEPYAIPLILILSVICWSILYLAFVDKIKLSNYAISLLFVTAWFLIFLVTESRIYSIKPYETYETILYPIVFLISYIFNSSVNFTFVLHQSIKRNFYWGISRSRYVYKEFGRSQKISLIWGPLITFYLYLVVYFQRVPEFNTKITIIAWSFLVISIFNLHIPDYLLCLPLWLWQRRTILKNRENTKKMIKSYQQSILFKHERIYFQLPGMHKVMAIFARDKEVGIKEAVEFINHLYRFTFQQKQAQKAIITLGKDNETAHQCIHFLLEENNLPLIKTLAEINHMAEFYLILFEKKTKEEPKKKDNEILLLDSGENFPTGLQREKKRQYIPETLEDRLSFVCQEMAKKRGYHFNDEIIKTLEVIHQFLTANSLKDFYDGCETLEKIIDFPREIKYFIDLQCLRPQLKKIKDDLLKIESIERFDTKRSLLSQQKESLVALAKKAEESFYDPFRAIWKEALSHCAGLVKQEIKLLQGSAVLSIELKNKEILASEEERRLCFEIRNKGQELAADVSITLQIDSPAISFPDGTKTGIDIIESDKSKEISFSITPHFPDKTTLKGTLTFSDRAMEGKKLDFSFPVTILRKSAEFKEIENPYIVGPPLKGDAPLFFGREDAHEFIDNNILAPGGHHTIVCHGLRRTGKTSLLYRIGTQGLTDKRLVPINFDMQGVDDEKDFYYTLSNAIIEELSLQSAAPVENFNRFKGFLKDIKPELGERIIVLMVDEFEELQMRVEEKKISKSVFSNIRHLMQHEEKLILFFCGTHQLEEMSTDYWSIFFNTATYFRISHLKREDAIRLIKEPVKGQLTYDDLAVEQILKMTNGQPYLTQLICRTLIHDLNENKKRNDALIDDVDDVVEHITNEGKEHFSQHIWDESNQLEQLILSAAAEELTQKQLDHVGPDAIFDKIKPLLPDFSRKQSMEALDKLVSKEILAERNLRYWFPVNLLRKWIAARYPLRKVREEILLEPRRHAKKREERRNGEEKKGMKRQ